MAAFLRLLHRVNALPPTPTSPLRRENLHLAIVILYTTGLRLGELVRLLLRDDDPHERTLPIRDSKFHKSRLVPLSLDDAAKSIGIFSTCRLGWRRAAGSPGAWASRIATLELLPCALDRSVRISDSQPPHS